MAMSSQPSSVERRSGSSDTASDCSSLAEAFDGEEPLGARQLVVFDVDLVQTSCGFGVPLYDYRGERGAMSKWAEAKGPEGLEAYRREHNARSIDGLPTGLLEDEPATV